nr:rhomboid family intramembrane serine protease [Arthrobacter echini]
MASHGWLRMTGRSIAARPVTAAYLASLWLVGVTTGSLLSGPPEALAYTVRLSVDSAVSSPWTVGTALLWADSLVGYLLATIAVLLTGWAFERRMGSSRFLLAALAAHVVGVFLAVGFIHATRVLVGDWTAALVSESFMGVTGLACGAAAAGSAVLGTLWRRRLRVSLFTVVVLLALFSGTFQDMLNLFAAVVGAVMGPLLLGRRSYRPRVAVSRREARVLVALLVAACAAGPVIAALNTQAAGPLAVLEYLFTEVQPTDPATVTAVCDDPTQVEDCAAATLQLPPATRVSRRPERCGGGDSGSSSGSPDGGSIRSGSTICPWIAPSSSAAPWNCLDAVGLKRPCLQDGVSPSVLMHEVRRGEVQGDEPVRQDAGEKIMAGLGHMHTVRQLVTRTVAGQPVARTGESHLMVGSMCAQNLVHRRAPRPSVSGSPGKCADHDDLRRRIRSGERRDHRIGSSADLRVGRTPGRVVTAAFHADQRRVRAW